MVSREWFLTTIIVILGAGLCIRLGFWQLDRLEQRKAFNNHVEAMWNAPVINLPEDIVFPLKEMEYRSVVAKGEYDLESQVALRNQYWEDRYGYHLLTPLLIGEGVAVLVDRGWIPAEGNDNPDQWRKYDSSVNATVSGIIRLGREKPDVGGRPDPTLGPDQQGLDYWNNVNLPRLQQQVPYELLEVYIQLDPVETIDPGKPIPFQPDIELTEGPHLGYAGQWFTFSLILLTGYPYFIHKREKHS